MGTERVEMNIGGIDFCLTTDSEAENLSELGAEVDFILGRIMKEHPRLSMTKSAILTALQLAEERQNAQKGTSLLKGEIQAYMEDASKAKTDAEVAKREVERLKKEIKNLKKELARYKK